MFDIGQLVIHAVPLLLHLETFPVQQIGTIVGTCSAPLLGRHVDKFVMQFDALSKKLNGASCEMIRETWENLSVELKKLDDFWLSQILL